MNLAAIPSPTTAVWRVDFFGLFTIPIRAYALCIVAGIIAACVVTEIRMRRRGAPPWAVLDIAVWAVPFGIVGARIYHVITSPDDYFGAGGEFMKAFRIWEGGLGIWGAVAGGAVGAWLACRQLRIPLTFVADALAPGLPLAQAIGRLGNWFNNELYGGRTELPWGLTIYPINPDTGKADIGPDGQPNALDGLYHPTFLYELLWNLGVALLVWQVDKRFKLGKGRAFALYVMGYTAGRVWIEAMRTDAATELAGVRINVWVSIVVFLGALAYFMRVRGPREYLVPVNDGEFRVATEAEFAAHQSGVALPGADGVDASGAGSDDPSGGDDPSGAGDPSGGDGDGSGDPSGADDRDDGDGDDGGGPGDPDRDPEPDPDSAAADADEPSGVGDQPTPAEARTSDDR